MPAELTAGDAAYLIYTSGSSGRPKGVINEHAGLALLARSTGRRFAISGADRVLQFANLAFDLALWEIFLSLANGAALVMADQDVLHPGPSLYALLKEQRVTVALLSPSVLRILPADNLPCLRLLVAGAERCPGDVMRRWKPGRRFFNAYGPTEASVCATIHEVEEIGESEPPIGKAVPGSTVVVLGSNGQQLTSGEPGELGIVGTSVARGYLNRPRLTAGMFRRGSSAGRTYFTGDLARKDRDGIIYFLGRLDSQVKIRGFRVEPEEVERVVSACPGVSTAAVFAFEDDRGHPTLYAFYSVMDGAAVDSVNVAAHVGRQLPAFMQPARYVRLTQWPLTPNAKLDLGALRRIAAASTTVEGDIHHNCSATLELCRKVLRAPVLAPEADLLLAGLNSILAAEILWAIKDRFGAILTFRDILSAKTAAALENILKRRVDDAGGVTLPTDLVRRSGPISIPSECPISPAQRRFYLLHQAETTRLGHHIEAGVRIGRPYDPRRLRAAILVVAERHEALRTTFHERGGKIIQRVHAIGVVEITEVATLAPSGGLPDRFRRPFNLSQLPLIRAFVIRHGKDAFDLILDLAHIVSDARSVEIVMDDLSRAIAGEDLGPRPLPYTDYILWNRVQLQSIEQARAESHWRGELDSPPPPPDWPRTLRGLPRTGAEVTRLLIEGLTCSGIRQLASHFGVTEFMLLSAIYGVFLSRLTGAQDIIFQSVFAGRSRPELQDIVGPFARSLPLRVRPAQTKTFRTFVAEIAGLVEIALEHQDFDFETAGLVIADGGIRGPCKAGFTLQGMPNPFSDRIYAEDIPWPVDLNVEVCAIGGAYEFRIVCARSLSAPGASSAIARELACVIEKVLDDPEASLLVLTTAENSGSLSEQRTKFTPELDLDLG
jgi:hypothetical protein